MTDDARIIYSDMPPQPLENIQQDTPDCSPADNPVLFVDNEATYQLVLQVTADQWVRLFSAATAGADLLYPDSSLDAVFPLRRAVDCMPTFCEAVNECISTVPDIKITLISITNYWGEAGEDGENPPVLEVNPIIAEDCDLDNLFGACTQMVDLIDQTITDVFETIEAITNSVELANEVLELIPGLNFLASVLDIANVLQEQLAENYASEYTATVRDELRCALFCACKDDCILDFAKMTEVFGELAGQAIFKLDLDDFIEFFTTGTFSGIEIVYASFWFVAGMLNYGGAVLNIDSEKLLKLAASFLNDPDSDWTTLCTDCTWTYDVDFTDTPGEWLPYPDLIDPSGLYDASWQNGVGWRRFGSGTGPFGIGILAPTGTELIQVLVEQQISISASGWVFADKDATPPPSTEIVRNNSRAAAGSNTYIDNVSYTVANGVLVLQITRQNNSTITVSRIRLRGNGDNPFV